jgi:hypothetical protein
MNAFEAAMMRAERVKRFVVACDFSDHVMTEIDAFFRRSGKSIVALTVQDILDEEIARKLA